MTYITCGCPFLMSYIFEKEGLPPFSRLLCCAVTPFLSMCAHLPPRHTEAIHEEEFCGPPHFAAPQL